MLVFTSKLATSNLLVKPFGGIPIAKYKYTIILFVLIVIFSFISIFIGAYNIDLAGLMAGDFNQILVLTVGRIPRVLAILCTGVGMSVAGLIMQNLCRNKFVSPTTGATISSAQSGVLLTYLAFPTAGLMGTTLITFVTSILGTWVFVWFIQRIKFKDVIMVPLIGIMFGTVIGGVNSYFAYEYGLMQAMSNTFTGSFAMVTAGRYEIVFIVVPLVILAFIFANYFNIVGLGETFSKNLGVNYNFVLFGGLTIAAVLTAAIIVTVGTISYIGLIIPNLVSMFRGDKIKGTILDVSLFGALFVLICDIIARIVIHPYELPVDLISGVIGSALFIAMLFKRLNPGKPKVKKEIADAKE